MYPHVGVYWSELLSLQDSFTTPMTIDWEKVIGSMLTALCPLYLHFGKKHQHTPCHSFEVSTQHWHSKSTWHSTSKTQRFILTGFWFVGAIGKTRMIRSISMVGTRSGGAISLFGESQSRHSILHRIEVSPPLWGMQCVNSSVSESRHLIRNQEARNHANDPRCLWLIDAHV